MWRFVVFLLLFCAWVVPSLAHAQTELPQVVEGDRVRVTASAVQGVFVVAALDSDTLALRGRTSAVEPILLPLTSITRLDVRRPRSRKAGFLRGAGIGLLVGAGVGAIIGFAEGDDEKEESDGTATTGFLPSSAMGKAFLLGFCLAGPGLVVGSVIGLAAPGKRWEPVSLHQRLGLSSDRNGALALSYSYSF